MTKFEKRVIAQILTAALAFTCFAGVNPADRTYAAEVQDEQQMESTETDVQSTETTEEAVGEQGTEAATDAVETEETESVEDTEQTSEAETEESETSEISAPELEAQSQTLTANDYTYHLDEDGNAVIDNYTGTAKEVSIPEKLNGKTVAAIGECAFAQKQVTKVTVPKTVAAIEYWSFADSSLETLEFTSGNNLKKIGKQAFYRTAITKMIIPDSVTELGEGAFYDCRQLNECTIGTGISQIQPYTFCFCDSLKSIVIPDNVTSIGEGVFYYSQDLTKVTLGKNLQEIGKEAFYECTALQEITIPDSVWRIGTRAFKYCSALKKVIIGGEAVNVDATAFEQCESLQSPELLKLAGSTKTEDTSKDAFRTSVEVPASVTEIQYGSLEQSDSEIKIDTSSNLSTISGSAFESTAWYTNLPDGLIYTGKAVYGYKGTMPENSIVAIKSGTLGIASLAFLHQKNLTEITIPNGVTDIGTLAFFDCTGLTNIVIPYSVKDIGQYAIGYLEGAWNIQESQWTFIDDERRGFYMKKQDGLTITGYAGSAAESYAKGNDIPFIAIAAPKSVTLNTESVTLKKNETISLTATVLPESAEDKSVTWTSSNPAIASVSDDGTVTAIKGGNAKITATTANGLQAVCTVAVEREYKGVVTDVKAAAAGKNKVKVTWGKVADADGYIIYASKADTYAYCGMASKDATSYMDTKALDGEYNFYWVFPYQNNTAENVRNMGDCTKYGYAKGVLPAATNFKAKSAGKNKVSLSWNKVDGADGYIVYAKKNGTYAYCGMTTKGTTYTDAKALDSDYNFYWVYPYANNAAGKRVIGTGSKYVYAKGVLPAVSNLKAAGTKSGVTVSWSKMKDATGYIIYKKNAQTGKFEYLSMTGNASYVDKTASKTAYNFYRVYAYYKDANGKRVLGTSDTYVYAKGK